MITTMSGQRLGEYAPDASEKAKLLALPSQLESQLDQTATLLLERGSEPQPSIEDLNHKLQKGIYA